MIVSPQAHSPLARLVLFMVCLSIFGCALAGAHYVVLDLPAQAAVHAPSNSFGPRPETCTKEGMDQCETNCMRPDGLLNLNCYEACIFSIC